MSIFHRHEKTPHDRPDNLRSSQVLSVIDVISEGPIAGPVSGIKSVLVNGTSVLGPDARQITGDIYNVQSGGVVLPDDAFSWSDKKGEHVIFRIAGESFGRILDTNLTLTAQAQKKRQEFRLIIRHHDNSVAHTDVTLDYADTGNKGKSLGMHYRLNGISLPAIGRTKFHELIMIVNNSGRSGRVCCCAPSGELPKFTAYRAGRQFVMGAER